MNLSYFKQEVSLNEVRQTSIRKTWHVADGEMIGRFGRTDFSLQNEAVATKS